MMANLLKGEVPFKAADRDMFVRYGTPEIAEIQAALGYRRPDPFQPDIVEEIDVAVEEKGRPKLDDAGLAVFKRERLLVDASERQRRMMRAFEACWMDPDPEALLVFFRAGLKSWERLSGTALTKDAFREIVDALGLARLKILHIQAITFGCYLQGAEDGGEGAGKVASAESVSTI